MVFDVDDRVIEEQRYGEGLVKRRRGRVLRRGKRGALVRFDGREPEWRPFSCLRPERKGCSR